MIKNFVNEYEKLEDKRIMGVYGTPHVLPYSNYVDEVTRMGVQLDKKYRKIFQKFAIISYSLINVCIINK